MFVILSAGLALDAEPSKGRAIPSGCHVPTPAASDFSTYPNTGEVVSLKPVICVVPATSSFCAGFDAPIPTLPPFLMNSRRCWPYSSM
jgi:hypothetical protein